MNIKKVASVFVGMGLCVSAAEAKPSYLVPDNGTVGAYDVTYNYTDKPKNNWYGTARAELNMLSWTNKYTSEDVINAGSDKYSMEPLFGGSLAVGKKLNYFWRLEVEAGYITQFEDSDATATFRMSVPYAIGNLMYDFNSGLYLGAGFGFAKPTTTWDGDLWVYNSNRTESTVSPMGALMIGYTHKLDDNFVLDLRYRIAGFSGTEQEVSYETKYGATTTRFDFENKIGLILDNSVSVGLRYEF